MDDVQAVDYPLEKLKSVWVQKIRAAIKVKREQFGDVADECMAFFEDAYDMMFGDLKDRRKAALNADGPDTPSPNPTYGIVVNKIAEFVRIMGPVLYQKNPVRSVTPRKIPQIDLGPLELAPYLNQPVPPQLQMMGVDPMMLAQQQAQMAQQQRQTEIATSQAIDSVRAQLMGLYLNWSPQEFDLKESSRQAIDEALIKGRGVVWTELVETVDGNRKIVSSFYDSVDNLLIDPDATTLEDASWIAKECLHPIWQIEEDYNLPRGTLRTKGNMSSSASTAENSVDVDGELKKAKGETNDLLRYWKIWTKMGMGDNLKGAEEKLQGAFDSFGRYCYLVVAEKVPFFLNLPPALLSAPMDEQVAGLLQQSVSWPTPCWGMLGKKWPVRTLDFYKVPGSVWPQAPCAPGLGELKAIQWIMSFLVGKINNTCRDFIVIPKAANDELKEKILKGTDLELLEVEQTHPGTIDKLIGFIQHPNINGDVWKILEALQEQFNQRVGLTELMYGMSGRQLRSASEAKLKGDYLSVRPDDMSDRVEDWARDVAEAEAFAVRWHLTGQDVAQVIGNPYAPLWDQFIASASIDSIANDLEYRIESGTARKPNKERDIAVIDESAGYIFGPLIQIAMATQDIAPVNAWIAQWCKSRDIDPEPFMIQPPPPPPMPAPQEPPPDSGEEKKKKPEKPAEPAPQEQQAPPPQAAPQQIMPMTDPISAALATQMPLIIPSVSRLAPVIQGLPR